MTDTTKTIPPASEMRKVSELGRQTKAEEERQFALAQMVEAINARARIGLRTVRCRVRNTAAKYVVDQMEEAGYDIIIPTMVEEAEGNPNDYPPLYSTITLCYRW